MSEMTTFGPWLEYVWNYDYISQVLCINKEVVEQSCNGKCFLMARLAQAEEDNASPNKRVPKNELEKTPFMLNDSVLVVPVKIPYLQNIFFEIKRRFPEVFVIPLTPPPQV